MAIATGAAIPLAKLPIAAPELENSDTLLLPEFVTQRLPEASIAMALGALIPLPVCMPPPPAGADGPVSINELFAESVVQIFPIESIASAEG